MKKQTRKAGYNKGYATGRKFDKNLAFYITMGVLAGALVVFISYLLGGI
jgi:hypothetical protein